MLYTQVHTRISCSFQHSTSTQFLLSTYLHQEHCFSYINHGPHRSIPFPALLPPWAGVPFWTYPINPYTHFHSLWGRYSSAHTLHTFSPHALTHYFTHWLFPGFRHWPKSVLEKSFFRINFQPSHCLYIFLPSSPPPSAPSCAPLLLFLSFL